MKKTIPFTLTNTTTPKNEVTMVFHPQPHQASVFALALLAGTFALFFCGGCVSTNFSPEAVRSIDDQAALAKIAKKDNAWRTRQAAVERLNDLSVLEDVKYHDKGREELIKVPDKGWFFKTNVTVTTTQSGGGNFGAVSVSYYNTNYRVHPGAVPVDESEVQPVRDAAIRRWDAIFDDQALLAELAKTHANGRTRQIAVMELHDQATVTDIARNDKDWQVRQTAVMRLDDQTTIAEIARSAKDWEVRLTALANLTDQATFEKIVRNDTDFTGRVRRFSTENSQVLLAKFATGSNVWLPYKKPLAVRLMAVEKIHDKALLEDVARNATWFGWEPGHNAACSPQEAEMVREAAKKRLETLKSEE